MPNSDTGRHGPDAEPPGADASSSGFPLVAIGASAGGLEACSELVKALPRRPGMAFILVQHLDPSHESMLAELLSTHSRILVQTAADGMRIEPDHFYVIPPAVYLTIAKGVLHTEPALRGGARLPFDLFLSSLAQERGGDAVAVVLSGTGADGSRGIKSVKEKNGLVIAQDPAEAAFDGMPRNAVMTGAVDLVLRAGDMPKAISDYFRRTDTSRVGPGPRDDHDWLPAILALIRRASGHDFSAYKEGTLRRRIDRRRALASIDVDDMAKYLDLLNRDAAELDLLVKDLLINVTSFFRDPDTFALLSGVALPELIKAHPAKQPIRVWVAGCSTGEEAYSLAILLLEEIAASRSNLRVQIFASDVDEEAIAAAREGLFHPSIATEISPERLERFFIKEETGYRAMAELRSSVVFTVHDVLSDPPFSRLDLVSCRNLLIYFSPEAQARAMGMFHFALKDGGLLLLGGAETAGDIAGRFEPISKAQRLYRRIGRSRPIDFGFSAGGALEFRSPLRAAGREPPPRATALAELARQLVLTEHAPAAVLINAQYSCLYALGPLDRYLKVPQGYASHDLLGMAPQALRTRLRHVIEEASRTGARATASGGKVSHDGSVYELTLTAQAAPNEAEPLTLVCFIETQRHGASPERDLSPQEAERVEELEAELSMTRLDLQTALRELERATEEQKTIREEALSVSEEFQSTNEELVTSKEELQSLNEELTTLNTQLQETLEQQRRTSDDLQNVLFSTNVATLFLDAKLRIRFYTPAIRSLFSVIPGDVGRPLADLSALSTDVGLLDDAREVLRTSVAIETEIKTGGAIWFSRRIQPYRTQHDTVEGVVVTFTDITERRRASLSLEAARRVADQANAAKTRFLAAASHDLRQPLQTLSLLNGLLASKVDQADAQSLLARGSDALGAMTGMLNKLLDVNQIEAGTIQVAASNFRVGDLLNRLRHEYDYQASARGVELRVVPSNLTVRSDGQLLEQMLRNLLSNALKYTDRGRILLGCRRQANSVRVEVWDTGAGMPTEELSLIFDEYYQIGSPAHGRGRGLGLGLSIVKRLADLLCHSIHVRSTPYRGSMFSITVDRVPSSPLAPKNVAELARPPRANTGAFSILVIDDDPQIRELLALLFSQSGHQVITARDGEDALRFANHSDAGPDLILADNNLPGALSGVQTAKELRTRLNRVIPVIVLSGDISTVTLREIADAGYHRLSKPVEPTALLDLLDQLLSSREEQVSSAGRHSETPVVYVVDDDPMVLDAMRAMLAHSGVTVLTYSSGEAFFANYRCGSNGCLLVDVGLPGMSGHDILRRLRQDHDPLPTIMITGAGEIAMAVDAMKAGAFDFISKPVTPDDLLASVRQALDQSVDAGRRDAARRLAAEQIAGLTMRQHDILGRILAGHPNKIIASDLGLSQRTVENHRAAIMSKTGAKSLPDLVRLAALAATDLKS